MCKRRESHYGSKWIRPEKRLAIYLRDQFQCCYCGKDMHGADPADITLDHVVPVSKNGGNDAMNLITACRSCNSARQDKPVVRFASDDAQVRIRRNRRRVLTKYLKLAKSLIERKSTDEHICKSPITAPFSIGAGR